MTSAAMTPGLLEAAFPGRHRAKRIGSLLPGRSLRTIRRILAGLGEPTASELIDMARQSREMRAELLRLLGDFDADTCSLVAGAAAAPPVEVDGPAGRPDRSDDVTWGRG